MVGADPNTCSGSACDVTIQADITPIKRHRRRARRSTATTSSRPRSPRRSSRTTTTARRRPPRRRRFPRTCRAARAARCRRLDAGVRCSSRTRRCGRSSTRPAAATTTCGCTRTSSPPVTINVPSNQGTLLQSGRGVIFARHQHQLVGRADQQPRDAGRPDPPAALPDRQRLPAHRQRPRQLLRHRLPRHAGRPAPATATASSNGNAPVQTFAWASYVRPGIYARPERRHRLGAAGHPRDQPRDRRVGRRPVRQQLGEPVADADRAAVRLHERPRDRRPGRRDRLRDGDEHLPAGPEPERHAERRRLLPPGGRGAPAVVHAAAAEHTGSEPTQSRPTAAATR